MIKSNTRLSAVVIILCIIILLNYLNLEKLFGFTRRNSCSSSLDYSPILQSKEEKYSLKCRNFHSSLINHYIPNIQKPFITNSQSSLSSGKAIVWRCKKVCGGLGDRLRGIVTTFTLAVLTDSAFFIDHTPDNFKDYFQFLDTPNDIDLYWYFNETLISHDGNGKERRIKEESSIDSYQTNQERFETEDFLFETLATTDVLIINTNTPVQNQLLRNRYLSDAVVRYNLNQLASTVDLTGCILQFLLQPKSILKQRIEEIKKQHEMKENYIIGIQIRTGGDDPDKWKDDKRVPQSGFDYFWNCTDRIEKYFYKQLQRGTRGLKTGVKYFLSTDSDNLKQQAREKFGDKLILLEAKSVHIDKFEADEVRNGLLDTILDFMILATATDKLVISRSNFGEVAALFEHNSAYMYPKECEIGRGELFDFTQWWEVDAPFFESS